jgi:IS605 OrfB family transposase
LKTEIAFSDNLNAGKYAALTELAKRLGTIRTEIWQRFGSIKSVGLNDRQIRDSWLDAGREFNVRANSWKETLRDAMDNIKTNREAAKYHVRQAIRSHTTDKEKQKRLYTLLKSDKWMGDRYLRRTMRQYWHRGHNHTDNQIMVRSDDYTTFILNKNVWLKIPSLTKGKRMAIPLSTTKAPTGTLRILLRHHKVKVHYAVEQMMTNDCGSKTIGVDKGFTEVLTDSDGTHYGTTLGQALIKESDRLKIKYQRRNKLKMIANKKPHVIKHNLGRKKLDAQTIKHQANIKTIVYEAVNRVVDKASTIAAEDLTQPFAGKKFSKNVSRRLSSWTKGVIAKALENVSHRRGSTVILVNAAYTSQVDSVDNTLSGRRSGDKFYRENGEVLQADMNGARNTLARLYDTEISRFTPYNVVKSILLKRTECHRLKLLNLDSSYTPNWVLTESESPNEYVCI